jgi:hypothetical protein
MNNFLWLEHWFHGTCDGLWEHGHAITITTLDNPGWSFRVDLKGTPFDQAPNAILKQMHSSDRDWMTCRTIDGVFEGFGGPLMLGPIVQEFRNWIQTY